MAGQPKTLSPAEEQALEDGTSLRAYPYVAPEDARNNRTEFILSKAQVAREQMIKVQLARLLQEDIKQCRRREGSNHYHNCKKYTERYMQFLKSPTFMYRAPHDYPAFAPAEE